MYKTAANSINDIFLITVLDKLKEKWEISIDNPVIIKGFIISKM